MLEYIQYVDCVDSFMDYTYVNIHKIVHFKYIHFAVHLHSNESLLKSVTRQQAADCILSLSEPGAAISQVGATAPTDMSHNTSHCATSFYFSFF